MKRIKRFSDEYFRAIAPECETKLLSSLTEDEAIPPHVFSDGFSKNMDDIFRLVEKPKGITPLKVKIAVAVAVALIAAMLAAFSVGAGRDGLYDMVFLERDYSHAVAQFQPSKDVKEPAPNGIECVYLPSYMPEGYVDTEDYYSELFCSTCYYLDGKHLMFDQSIIDTPIDFDIQNTETDIIKINGNDAFFSVKGAELVVIWTNNEYCFVLAGYMSKEEAVKVIESVEKTDIVPKKIVGENMLSD